MNYLLYEESQSHKQHMMASNQIQSLQECYHRTLRVTGMHILVRKENKKKAPLWFAVTRNFRKFHPLFSLTNYIHTNEDLVVLSLGTMLLYSHLCLFFQPSRLDRSL
jgi:hypothetical protein